MPAEDKALAIALGADGADDDKPEEDSGRQDELDAAAAFREAMSGDDDEAIVDTLEALVRLVKRRK